MIELTNYKDIIEFIATLPGSYPDITAKKAVLNRTDPIDRKATIILAAEEIDYIFKKWNVSKPDRKKLIELLINIKALQ